MSSAAVESLAYDDLLAQFEASINEDSPKRTFIFAKHLLNKHTQRLRQSKAEELRLRCFLAAAHVGQDTEAKTLWSELEQHGASGPKLDRLAISAVESSQKSDPCYEAVCRTLKNAADNSNTEMADRHIVLSMMLRKRDDFKDYAKLLEEQLEDVPTDVGGWRAMLSLCVQTGRLLEARAAAEELALVLEPQNFFDLITLADICFVQGNVIVASKYFSVALIYEPFHGRPLWGILQCFIKMLEDRELFRVNIESNTDLALECGKRLLQLYTIEAERSSTNIKQGTQTKGFVQTFLETQIALCSQLVEDISSLEP